MAISRVDFWCFINELVTRNPNLGIATLEDGLFANLLIFGLYPSGIFFLKQRSEKFGVFTSG